ncbi:hypothetical protein K8I61_18885 [bacterium]|nr:hypothetical protein [bacterium]
MSDKPESPEQPGLADLAARLSETLARLESANMNDDERARAESARRLDELGRERERLANEAREWETRYKTSRARQLLTEAASNAGAYRADQVVRLMWDRVRFSTDGEPRIAIEDDGGAEKLVEPNRFTETVRAFLDENPNLAAGRAGGGAGSRASNVPAPGGAPPRTLSDLRQLRPALEERAKSLGRRG